MAKKTPSKKSRPASLKLLRARSAEQEQGLLHVAKKIDALRKDIDQIVVEQRMRPAASASINTRTVMDLSIRLARLEESSGPTWKTGSGIVLRMRDMEDSHLANAIAFLERQEKVKAEMSTHTNEMWRKRYIPKLNEMRAEQKHRAYGKAQEAKWAHLHNGTGPYDLGRGTLSIGGKEVGKCKSFRVSPSQSALLGQPIFGMVIDEVDDGKTIETCKRKWWNELKPEVGTAAFRDRLTAERLLTENGALKRDLDAKDARIHDLENKLADVTNDGNLSYWKRSAEARLDTVLRLRTTVVALRNEVQRLKGLATRTSTNLKADVHLANAILTDLLKLVPHPLGYLGKSWIPASRAGRIESMVKRLAELLK